MVPDLRSSPTLGFGYVVNAPRELVGFSVLGLTPALFGGAGLYADVKFTHHTPANDPYYLSDVTVEQAEVIWEDVTYDQQSVWVSVNLAMVYTVSRELGLYAGGGYSKQQRYNEYFDRTQTRGNTGFYWVHDEADSGNRVNILGGMLLRAATHLVIQVGLESEPLGGTVGMMLTLPF